MAYGYGAAPPRQDYFGAGSQYPAPGHGYNDGYAQPQHGHADGGHHGYGGYDSNPYSNTYGNVGQPQGPPRHHKNDPYAPEPDVNPYDLGNPFGSRPADEGPYGLTRPPPQPQQSHSYGPQSGHSNPRGPPNTYASPPPGPNGLQRGLPNGRPPPPQQYDDPYANPPNPPYAADPYARPGTAPGYGNGNYDQMPRPSIDSQRPPMRREASDPPYEQGYGYGAQLPPHGGGYGGYEANGRRQNPHQFAVEAGGHEIPNFKNSPHPPHSPAVASPMSNSFPLYTDPSYGPPHGGPMGSNRPNGPHSRRNSFGEEHLDYYSNHAGDYQQQPEPEDDFSDRVRRYADGDGYVRGRGGGVTPGAYSQRGPPPAGRRPPPARDPYSDPGPAGRGPPPRDHYGRPMPPGKGGMPPPGRGGRGAPPPGWDPRRGPPPGGMRGGRPPPPPGWDPRRGPPPGRGGRPPPGPGGPDARGPPPGGSRERSQSRPGERGPSRGPEGRPRAGTRAGGPPPEVPRGDSRSPGPPGPGIPPRPSTAPGRRPNDRPDRTLSPPSSAVPSHNGPVAPLPIRPGAMNAAGPNGSLNDKPAPVRQYDVQNSAPTAQKEKRKSVPISASELASVRGTAQGQPHSPDAQLELAKGLIRAADTLTSGPNKDADRHRYLQEAQKIGRQLVQQQNRDAMFFWADGLGSGLLGLPNDPREAFTLYQSAGKAGHPQAAYRTAVCCEMGPEEGGGTKRDLTKAVQWYRHAASLGDGPAMFKLGMISLRGLLEQPRNYSEAVSWLQKAADKADENSPHAVHELGILYEGSENAGAVPRDDTRALQLFTKGAKLSYRASQYKLGHAWEYGALGCPIDARNSIIWYTRAAAQGEHNSELALSGWYLTGAEGILEHNDTEAYLWARKAASSGLPKALFALGYYTEVGIGCTRSLEESKRWYGKAAAAGFDKARQRMDELNRGGARAQKSRERISRSNPKQKEQECIVM
ncbi:MAG: hypothetical protein Q9159_005012 [Coniocarpon cinnabarinum]